MADVREPCFRNFLELPYLVRRSSKLTSGKYHVSISSSTHGICLHLMQLSLSRVKFRIEFCFIGRVSKLPHYLFCFRFCNNFSKMLDLFVFVLLLDFSALRSTTSFQFYPFYTLGLKIRKCIGNRLMHSFFLNRAKTYTS